MESRKKFNGEWDDLSFEYPLYYEGNMVSCRIEPGESGYGVKFDGRLVAELAMNESNEWEQNSGTLDEDTVYSIGLKINDHFE
ncbi:hypothetical protein KHS38_11880 [Mucilaginibacter sp. Bleaf8]|uniref:hypothetical protein n=1 Tax=Mucilaginibacter sp. Bleaf8 TaxID=2834430 RepID=UPI001BCF0AB7|nr:hypothetical protein [Mucilaginibacter sp. Bleaf8]MBS7565105.1 hypothetical protein [Mucilaginibacter sp. Bleaf8]